VSRKCYFICIAIVALAILPAIAHACTGRLINVTPAAGGCVNGPTGSLKCAQVWDVEPGHTYTLTIANVTECAHGGTDPTLNVRVNSSTPGQRYTDLVAVYVSPGVYRFDYVLSAGAVCTMPIFYCTTPGVATSGLYVRRNDGESKPALLRASRFESVGMGCTNPIPIIGPECGTLGIDDSSWGTIKAIYK
jgi:hypothetical protein